ncbi:MAG TPA: MauE/DoxX family redox-associated membrane protein [Polyangiaceae bacterium]|nr:MauE/DoxX family redox-associated membrane protein [Polyangiaceae bacterium]
MRPLAYLAARLGLGALFLVAGALKLRDPYAFALEIANYQLFPALAPWLAAALPATEIVVGVALVAGPRPWARAGALAAALLLGAFTVAATSAVVRGVNISCGCFGADSGPVTWLTVARDVGLVALALWVYARPEPLPRWPSRRPGAASAAR